MKACFVMLGRRDMLTGGYVFNRRMVEALERRGIETEVVSRESVPERVRNSVPGTSFYLSSRIAGIDPDVLIISKSYLYMMPLRLRLASRPPPAKKTSPESVTPGSEINRDQPVYLFGI